jgi:pyruvate,water dikinase
VAEFRRQLAYARQISSLLEVHNHYIDQMLLGQLRHAVMAAGRRLVAYGALSTPEDVLWLHVEEVTSALRTEQPEPFMHVVAARRTEHAVWQSLEAPPIIGLPDPTLSQRPPLRDDVMPDGVIDERCLTGQGASAGHATGRARVVHDANALSALERGDILIAENIGPLWTPLFPILGGLVLEGGSILSHAPAPAREYGVPAVVNVKAALRRIPDGALVTMDGTTGIVEIASTI